MQRLNQRKSSECKRDALPTELTARVSEMAAFRPILKPRICALAEPSGNERHCAVQRVPNYSRSRKAAGQEALRCQGRDTRHFRLKSAVFGCSVARTLRERMGNLAHGYRTFTAQPNRTVK